MADRQPESAIAISFAVMFPCQLHAHFGLSTDVFTRLRYNLLNISGYQHDCIMADTFYLQKMIMLSHGLSKASAFKFPLCYINL